jgi:acetyl-CoA carboxylase biotin carboxyl carrier protein
MNLDEIRQILELMREHALAEFEIEQDGFKLRLRKDSGAAGLSALVSAPPDSAGPPAPSPAPAAAEPARPAEPEPAEVVEELAVVKSPIVGTFYRAPDPNAPPFVEVGDRVRKGQVLCIIEAMKLMNEIESEYEGEIVKIYVENGQPVQYGERLFAIRVG